MRILGLFTLVLLVVLGGCTGTQKNAAGNMKDVHCRNFIEDRTPISVLENLTFSTVKLDDNCLNITVRAPYCDIIANDFDLVWNGVLTKSLPPQINMSMQLDKRKTFKKKASDNGWLSSNYCFGVSINAQVLKSALGDFF